MGGCEVRVVPSMGGLGGERGAACGERGAACGKGEPAGREGGAARGGEGVNPAVSSLRLLRGVLLGGVERVRGAAGGVDDC